MRKMIDSIPTSDVLRCLDLAERESKREFPETDEI